MLGTSNTFGKTLKALYLSVILLFSAVLGSQASYANENVDVPTSTETKPGPRIEKILIAELEPEFTVILEGKTIQADVSRDENGGVYVRAEPIFTALGDAFEFNLDEGVLIVQRSQDGVVMELYTETGIVKANGRPLGKLKIFGEVEDGKINLTPNAIAVLSGAIGKVDEDDKQIKFKLDARLKVATGFEIFVNDIALGNLEPGPKSIGSVLLLPLRPIAKELGHSVTVIDNGSAIIVRRSQDSAEFELNLDTGLVKLNGRPIGVTKEITYIDKTNLLLPVSALETLTGSHVSVAGGSSRIEITLDDRLKGVVQPGDKISDAAMEAGFAIEAIEFHTGIDTINTAKIDFSAHGFNAQLRYEIPDLPTSIAEAEPSWLSVDYAHMEGGRGSIGDYSADLRELDGVGLRRIRGVSYAKSSSEGRWALAAGIPVAGSRKISDDQSRLVFSGYAVGARWADKDGWEAGVSYKMENLSNDQTVVLSAISGRLGRGADKKLSWNGQADIGGFSGPAREKPLDVRLNLNSRYDVSDNVDLDIFANYNGAEFLRGDLNAEDQEQAITFIETGEDATSTAELVPDVRVRGKDHMSFGVSTQLVASNDLGVFSRPAASMRYSKTISGALAGKESRTTIDNYGASVNTTITKSGTSLSADFNGYRQSTAAGAVETGNQITARAHQNFEYAAVRVNYSGTVKNGGPREQRLDGQLSVKPYKVGLPKQASLSVAPSISASITDEAKSLRGGVVASFNSGEILGKKTKLQARFGVLQNFSSSNQKKSDTYLTISLGRKLRINKNITLGLSYRNDLRGEQRLGIFLDGRYSLHEKRRFKSSQDGRGVLKGRAFLDKNRDGIRQEDEPGIAGAIVSVNGTRLALRTDRDGYYTIQNMPTGLHELHIEGRSLPLGYALSDDVYTKASIREGHITDVNLPIVQRGQITGFAYVDGNGDGSHNKGEKRLEGAKLTLVDVDDRSHSFTAYTASFGQYAFDDLPSGTYEMVIFKTNAPGAKPSEPIIIDLAASDNLMSKTNISAEPIEKTRSANQNSEPDLPARIRGREEDVQPPEYRESEPAPP